MGSVGCFGQIENIKRQSLKYGISSEDTKQFQIRSFYKCTEQRDIIKFDGLTKTHIRENLYAYVNKTINKNGNHQES